MRVVTVLALLCLAVAVIRQPVTRWATRRSLDKMQGYRGDFLDARISFLPLSYTITRLKLVPDDTSLPTFYVERLQSGLFARDLIRGRLRAWANVERAKMTFFLIPGHRRHREFRRRAAEGATVQPSGDWRDVLARFCA
jgi:hypothetical protein